MTQGPLILPNTQTSLYGIFGNPVHHSISPLLHNSAFSQEKINAVYLAFPVEPAYLGIAFEAMRAMGMRGANITIPFKEIALDFIDEVPEDIDRCIGAINTVHVQDGKLLGYNTDGKGFLQSLHEDLSFNPEARSILVLGAGGAARGVVFSLARAHADKLWIYNRSPERAQGLAEHARTYFPETEFEAIQGIPEIQGERIDLVVNATSCGMGNGETPFNLRLLEQKTAVYDLVYSPAETPLLKTAKTLGFSCANGLGMLVNQAALSFEIWTGKKTGVRETMLKALQGKLGH